MSNIRRDVAPTLSRRDGLRPRSPAEALEPGRAPPRPRDARQRRESRVVGGFARIVSGVLTVLLVGMVGLGALTFFVYHVYSRPGPLNVVQTVVVPKGAGSNEIADDLEREGVISSRWSFMVSYLVQSRMRPGEVVLKHGEYLFKPRVSVREVLEILSEGKSVQYRVTIPEGLTSHQIVERLMGEEHLVGEVTQIPAEGSLMPDTYSIEKGMERQELLRRMQAKQADFLAQVWERRSPDLPFSTPEEAVVMASIIEKETGRADERERIAGVFANRLRKNMRIQSDPTILYGVHGGAVKWGKPILRSEKDAKNAHNTYQINGLPPTPICNPGRPALEAALNPSRHEDEFFVADGTGGHIFSKTYAEHQTAVAKWREIERDIRARQAGTAEAETDGAGEDDDGAADGGEGTQGDVPVTQLLNAPSDTGAAAEPADGPNSAIPMPLRKPKS